MNVRRGVATLVTAVALVPLAGCAQEEPTAAATTSKASGPPTPTLPSPGTGATEVLRAWVTALVDMQNSGNTQQFLALSSDTCAFCTDFAAEVDAIYGAGGDMKVPEWTITRVDKQNIAGRGIFKQFHVDITSGPSEIRRAADKDPEHFTGEPLTLEISLRKTSAGWRTQAMVGVPRT